LNPASPTNSSDKTVRSNFVQAPVWALLINIDLSHGHAPADSESGDAKYGEYAGAPERMARQQVCMIGGCSGVNSSGRAFQGCSKERDHPSKP
jgi:hypothetical protein